MARAAGEAASPESRCARPWRPCGSLCSRDSEVLCPGREACSAAQNPGAASKSILDCFVELGGNFIDAAENYPVPVKAESVGQTEAIVGRWLQSRGAAARTQLVLATKVGGPADGRGTLDARQATLGREVAGVMPRLEPQQIRDALEASLVRLRTDYVDLYQLHWPDRYTPLWGRARYDKSLEGRHQQQQQRAPGDEGATFKEVALCMQQLIDEGKIREWGLSNETTFGVCSWVDACKTVGARPPISIQNDFSLLDKTPQTTGSRRNWQRLAAPGTTALASWPTECWPGVPFRGSTWISSCPKDPGTRCSLLSKAVTSHRPLR